MKASWSGCGVRASVGITAATQNGAGAPLEVRLRCITPALTTTTCARKLFTTLNPNLPNPNPKFLNPEPDWRKNFANSLTRSIRMAGAFWIWRALDRCTPVWEMRCLSKIFMK